MNNDPVNTRLVFISPPTETNTIDRGATYPGDDPKKEEPDGVRNQIEKANGNG
jgi:hypothetical protein